MLGRRFPFAFPGGAADDIWRGSGQRSTVRTAILEMTLDHDTGSTDGSVRSGSYAGRRLSSLSRDELFALLRECTLRDPQGSQLLRAYMEQPKSTGAGEARRARPGRERHERRGDL